MNVGNRERGRIGFSEDDDKEGRWSRDAFSRPLLRRNGIFKHSRVATGRGAGWEEVHLAPPGAVAQLAAVTRQAAL